MRNTQKPWTRKEEEELRALILSGKSVEAIAMKLGRTPLRNPEQGAQVEASLEKSILDAKLRVGAGCGSGDLGARPRPSAFGAVRDGSRAGPREVRTATL